MILAFVLLRRLECALAPTKPAALVKLRRDNLKAVRAEVANFKRFRKLVDQWADAAVKLPRLKTRLGLHSGES